MPILHHIRKLVVLITGIRASSMILLVDNYDSFVYNLARYLTRLGHTTRVVRNTSIDVSGVRELDPDALVFSPGPCTPSQAGCSIELIRAFADTLPILGVCLGHQAIAEAFGGQIARAKEPVHGRTSLVFHDGRGVFTGISSPLVGCRYHSLVVEENSLPPCLEISARTENQTVMALRHRHRPIVGLQFHPESILTDTGYSLLANFLGLSNLKKSRGSPTIDSELAEPRRPVLRPPSTPIPF